MTSKYVIRKNMSVSVEGFKSYPVLDSRVKASYDSLNEALEVFTTVTADVINKCKEEGGKVILDSVDIVVLEYPHNPIDGTARVVYYVEHLTK